MFCSRSSIIAELEFQECRQDLILLAHDVLYDTNHLTNFIIESCQNKYSFIETRCKLLFLYFSFELSLNKNISNSKENAEKLYKIIDYLIYKEDYSKENKAYKMHRAFYYAFKTDYKYSYKTYL